MKKRKYRLNLLKQGTNNKQNNGTAITGKNDQNDNIAGTGDKIQ